MQIQKHCARFIVLLAGGFPNLDCALIETLYSHAVEPFCCESFEKRPEEFPPPRVRPPGERLKSCIVVRGIHA